MDAALIEAAKQVPSLLVLAWIVYTFINELKAQRDRSAEATEAAAVRQNQTLQALGDSCHAFQDDMQKKTADSFKAVALALSENSTALRTNTTALGRVESVLDHLDGKK